MRWLWIDGFVEFRSKQSARAIKNLSLAEDHFAEHFPGYPVMPASLILEGLAQTGGILVGEANDFQQKVVLAKILWARFVREAHAGQQLIYDVEMMSLREEGASVKGRATVRDVPEEKGEGLAEAEIFFAHLDQSRSQQLFGEHNFVFSGELKHIMDQVRLLAKKNRTEGP
jgi:3-hydroxyacyl-[acyl-carrier-protein] dehydratase